MTCHFTTGPRSWDPVDVSEGVVEVEPLAAPDQLAEIPELSPDPETVQRDPMRIEQAWVESDGRTLWLLGLHGFGQRLHSVHVEERSNSVAITAMNGFDRQYLAMMIEEELDYPGAGHQYRLQVVLKEPLGTRRLIDGGRLLDDASRE